MLATEADVVRTLKWGTYTQQDIYDACESLTDITRDGGLDPVHPGDLRWQRRARGAIQTERRKGLAESIGDSRWLIRHGTPQRPVRLRLIVAGATQREFELRLAEAADLLAQLDGPVDLVLADPPYALGRGEGRRFADGHGYRRDASRIVPGYVDVDPARYADFTAEWITAAAAALRPGGQVVIITGPQRTGIVQCAAEAAGFTWVCKIAAERTFPLYTITRPSCAHWDVSVFVRGALTHPKRVFNPPLDLPKARSGRLYPLDWWPAEFNGRSDRPNLLRYDNSLPPRLVRRIVRTFSNPGEHVVDVFLGGGEGAMACYEDGRRYTGCDVNPEAIRFAAARLLDEHAWPAEKAPTLFDYPG
jgi:DNA modification methylase